MGWGISFNRNFGGKLQKRNSKNLVPHLIFGLLFLIIGGGGCFLFLYLPLEEVMESRHWQKIPAVILSSEVKSNIIRNGTKNRITMGHTIDITYHYRYGNSEYTGSRYDFFQSKDIYLSEGKDDMQKIVKQHSPGSMITCFVNPDNPEQSVICRSIYWNSLLIGIVPLLMLTASFFLLGTVLKRMLQRIKNELLDKKYKLQ